MKRVVLIFILLSFGFVANGAIYRTPLYGSLFSIDGKPVKIYSDSCKTKVIQEYTAKQLDDSVGVRISLRYFTSDMIGNKVSVYLKGQMQPEFEGWVEKKHCFIIIPPNRYNKSRIYVDPHIDSPFMDISNDRGIMANVRQFKGRWINVVILYYKPFEGWIEININ